MENREQRIENRRTHDAHDVTKKNLLHSSDEKIRFESLM